MRRGATVSKCGNFRFLLWREFEQATLQGARGTVAFVMLNPSTADAREDDPTIRRCMGFAKSWGFSRLEVVNLHPLRATDPADLNRRRDEWQMPSDITNERIIEEVLERAELVVAAWGAPRWDWVETLAERVVEMSCDGDGKCRLHVLGLTKHGYPRHPLYVRKDANPERWEGR